MSSQIVSPSTKPETGQFDLALSHPSFAGLKAVLIGVCPDVERLRSAVSAAIGYEDLLSRLGYKLLLTKQIHVQDCYSRMGAAGGIRHVLPYYDVPTQRSLPTLVNMDRTVTSTPAAAIFFGDLLLELQKRLASPASIPK